MRSADRRALSIQPRIRGQSDNASAVAGELLFARYAYPPNVLGYCGPEDHRALLEYAAADVTDDGLRGLARRFEGAWPYLQLIAANNGIPDPLDQRVVAAYWVGNHLLDRVPDRALARSVADRVSGPAPRAVTDAVDPALHGALAHHSFHVLGVYPWMGLLRAGTTHPSLSVLERCLIRWGTVRAVAADDADVDVVTLAWDGRHLTLGPSRLETFKVADGGYALPGSIAEGDVVAVHWDWICDRLGPESVSRLAGVTRRTLAAVDRGARPAPSATLA